MPNSTWLRGPAQSPAHRPVVIETGHDGRTQQQIRERLELQALRLGAPFDLAQLAADAWLREVVL